MDVQIIHWKIDLGDHFSTNNVRFREDIYVYRFEIRKRLHTLWCQSKQDKRKCCTPLLFKIMIQTNILSLYRVRIIVANDLCYDSWCERWVDSAENCAILSSPSDKWWINHSWTKLLLRTDGCAIYEVLKSIGKDNIVNLRPP